MGIKYYKPNDSYIDLLNHRLKVLNKKQSMGEITDFHQDKKIEISIGGHFISDFQCDFYYKTNKGEEIAEIVSSYISNKMVYNINKRLILALTNIKVKEV